MAVSVIFNQIITNNLSFNATIATGQNNMTSWQTQGKYNFGNGMPIGTNYVIRNVNLVLDQDTIDHAIDNSTFSNPQPNVQV